MTLGYYPGCSLHGTAREFDESVRAVARELAIPMREVDDWSCCGASSAHSTSHLLGVALPARNLALAEEQGYDSVLAPCAACFSRLAIARRDMARDPELAEQIPQIIERPFKNSVDVLNVVQFLLGHADTIRDRAAVSDTASAVAELKVAAYYGCLLVRPRSVAGADDREVPTTMEQVINAVGATPVKWNMAVECCGGSFSMSRTSSVIRLGRAIIEDARRAGAEAIVVGCPMCHANLDFRQAPRSLEGSAIPVIYLTQLVGLALGLDVKTLGLDRHFVDTQPLLDTITLRAERKAASIAAQSGATEAPGAAEARKAVR